jgi:predicted HTH transcriptional regulator
MLDIQQILQHKENYFIEVKTASGGIPASLWESYSAFANTDGGTILLDISETESGLKVVGVSDAEDKVKKLWDTFHNRQKINNNVLFERHIYIQNIDNKDIIVIEVPRADIKRPFAMRNSFEREDETDVHKALREVLANALIHADYYGRRGIVIEKKRNEIKISTTQLAKNIKVTRRTIMRDLDKLKSKGILERIGADKGGYWKVTDS